jgi:hypothetical protein
MEMVKVGRTRTVRRESKWSHALKGPAVEPTKWLLGGPTSF